MKRDGDKTKGDPEAGYVDEDEEEEEMPQERDLADDAQWKIIQKNTFTRWANEHLKQANKQLGDLQNDFSDGLRLLALVEVLADHKFKHINKRPTFRTQKLENVTMCLKFLEEYENLRLVNIDSSDIVDCRLKLILGLIWTLILHYSISMPMWEGEEELPKDEKGKGPTPKQRMLGWLNTKMPDKPIKNFTTDWNDGTAIGALVDACAPGLCPDWPDWNPKQALRNAKEALDAAEQWLEVPQLIKPDEMIDPKVDEKAMMTYLCQFPNAKLKPGAPLRPRTNPARVRAYGPGLDKEGNTVGAPARFTIETFSAGRGTVEVLILNPKGQKEPCEVVANNDRNLTYSCQYTPTQEGEYRVVIKFSSKEITNSPFSVGVKGAAGDPKKVTAKGPGVEATGNVVGRRTFFNIYINAAGAGNVDCVILDPKSRRDAVKPLITKQSDENYLVEYTAKEEGLHSINVFFAGQQIPHSPFGVSVGPRVNAKAAYATGRGIQARGVRVRDVATFFVHTEEAGEGEVVVKMVGPGGVDIPCQVRRTGPNLWECTYNPSKPGKYIITVTYGGGAIQKSPFNVEVGAFKESRVIAYGPGLHGGVVNRPAVFTVETHGETGNLGFSIEGPSEAKLDCVDNGDGSANVIYVPSLPGEYAVHVLCDNEDIPKSAFMAQIVPDMGQCDPNRVKAYGPGLEPGVKVSVTTEFTVDIRDAGGPAALKVECFDAFGTLVPVEMRDKGDGTYICRYTATVEQKHTVYISYGGMSIPKSPFLIDVSGGTGIGPGGPGVAKVKVYGPGVESCTRNKATYFTIDCKESGNGEVEVQVTDERGVDIPVKTKDNGDGTFRVDYNPVSGGPTYTVRVRFNGQEVPRSPFRVQVSADIDLSKVHVDNLEPRIYKESFARFTVDASPIDGIGKGTVKGIVTNPKGQRTACRVENKGDGTYKCNYSPLEEGPHRVDVLYEGLPVPGSPFPVQVTPGSDPTRVTAFGPGLDGGMTGQPQRFTIDLDGAGQGGLGLAIEGPGDAEINCKDNKDGTCLVEYVPTRAGTYDVCVKFNDEDIPGSPFHVPIKDELDVNKVKCYGKGLEIGGARLSKPSAFTVDASRAGEAPLQATITEPKKAARPLQILPTGGGAHPNVYQVTYEPTTEGPCTMDVTYGGKPVPGSPFHQTVLPACEPNKVRVDGEGAHPRAGSVPASIPTTFNVDARDAGEGELELSLANPQNKSLKLDIDNIGNGTFTGRYQPQDVGQHTLQVKYGGEDVPGSPFKVKTVPTGKADLCKIIEGQRDTIGLNQECVITVNTAQAGVGQLTCRIVGPAGEPLDVDVEDNGNGTVSIYYTPRHMGDYMIEIKFGGQPVPEGKFKQKAVPLDEVSDSVDGERIRPVKAGQAHAAAPDSLHEVEFKLPVGPVFANVKGEVHTPSGRTEEPTLVDNKDGTATVQYQPSERGMHDLLINYNEKPVAGSPFRFFVDSAATGRVHAYGPGLTHGRTGEPAEFTIVTKDAGAGGLALAIEGPSKSEIQCKDNKDGTCSVSYIATAPGDYNIILKFMDRHIPGSPFTAKVTGEPLKRAKVSVGTTSDVSLKIADTDISNLTASVRTPNGREEGCILKKMPNDHLGISFTPKEVGQHHVNVFRAGQHIPNSPFMINVSADEIGNADKVRVYGSGIETGMANQENQFTVDTRNAGFGGLSLSIEGPSKADIECYDNHDGTCTVTYRPTEPGTYLVNVRYADQSVPGSPFAVKIGGEASEKLMERITRRREAADVTHIGSQCELSLKIPGTNPLDMAAHVTSPSGVTEMCDIVDVDDCHYSIKFVPKEMGVHTVAVKHQGNHIPGSPFQFTVGPITEGGAHKVKASGPGLQHGLVHESNEFNILTREAGAGGLSIALEGPSKAEIDFEDRKDGSCGVSYTVTEAGDYTCAIKFNDDHIPGSPFRVYVGEPMGDGLLTATDTRTLNVGLERGLQPQHMIGRPAAFTVNFSGAKGKLRAYVQTPSGTEDEAIVQNIDRDQYAVRFIPAENGPHLIHVLMDDQPIPGSPFRILVGQYDADPGMVHASGEGLSRGRVGEKNRFFVNTVNAGSGALNVTVDGPSKVQLNCHERDDGYEFTYVPTAPGDYLITIKYGGNFHIVGSPFTAHITGDAQGSVSTDQQSHVVVETVGKTSVGKLRSRPDSHPELVHCQGLGLKKAVIGRSNQFNVDAGQAGLDILLIGICGPERPCEEVNVKHVGRNQFTVSYNVQERGTHVLMVKWGDKHVPGSPFVIDVP